MKIDEILSENNIGRVGPSVSTIDRSAPWVKQGMKIAGKTTDIINSDASVKDKFEHVLDRGKTSVIQFIFPKLGWVIFSKNNPSSKYDPTTGEVVFTRKDSQGNGIIYKTNIDNFSFDRREKSPSTSVAKYFFLAKEEPEAIDTFKVSPNVKKEPSRPADPPVMRNAFGSIIK